MKATFKNFDSKSQPLVGSLQSEKEIILTQVFCNFVNLVKLSCLD